MSAHQHVATNHSTSSENRIHSDDVAQQYGYRGALVAGVQVFGHMTYPLTETLGNAWMHDSDVSVRLLKPTYHGDQLNMTMTSTDSSNSQVDCHSVPGTADQATDTHVATHVAGLLASLASPRAANELALQVGPAQAPERVEITMERIELNAPFASMFWHSTPQENRRFAEQVGDDQDVYQEGLMHPHLVLHYANQALMARFILPAWLHVGSEIHFHRPLQAGETVEIRCVPTEKWERKGHQFIKVYIAYLVNDEPAVEIEHTAIFHIAPRG